MISAFCSAVIRMGQYTKREYPREVDMFHFDGCLFHSRTLFRGWPVRCNNTELYILIVDHPVICWPQVLIGSFSPSNSTVSPSTIVASRSGCFLVKTRSPMKTLPLVIISFKRGFIATFIASLLSAYNDYAGFSVPVCRCA